MFHAAQHVLIEAEALQIVKIARRAIQQAHDEIRRVAENFGLDTYPNQLEIITAEQMMDAYHAMTDPTTVTAMITFA